MLKNEIKVCFKNIKKFQIEIWLGIMVIIVAFGVNIFIESKEIIWSIKIFTAILAINLLLIKLYFEGIINKKIGISSYGQKIVDILYKLDGDYKTSAIKEIKELIIKLELIEDGIIPLDKSTYFHHIIQGVKKANKDTIIYAVNVINERRLVEDPQEKNYILENFEAVKRGIKINRIFILKDDNLDDDIADAIKKQYLTKGFNIYLVLQKNLYYPYDKNKDWVYYNGNGGNLYIGIEDKHDPTRVRDGQVIQEKDNTKFYTDRYETLKEFALDDNRIKEILKIKDNVGEIKLFSISKIKWSTNQKDLTLVDYQYHLNEFCKKFINGQFKYENQYK